MDIHKYIHRSSGEGGETENPSNWRRDPSRLQPSLSLLETVASPNHFDREASENFYTLKKRRETEPKGILAKWLNNFPFRISSLKLFIGSPTSYWTIKSSRENWEPYHHVQNLRSECGESYSFWDSFRHEVTSRMEGSISASSNPSAFLTYSDSICYAIWVIIRRVLASFLYKPSDLTIWLRFWISVKAPTIRYYRTRSCLHFYDDYSVVFFVG